MLTAYLDESGTDGRSAIVAVGGYVSTDDLWNKFRDEWQEFLNIEKIKIFHTTDLLALRGEFGDNNIWDRIRSESVSQRADKIIEKYVLFGVTAYTNIADCELIFPLKDVNGGRKKFSAEYLLSGTMVINLITSWAEENEYRDPIKFVFEDGAKGKGYLLEAIKSAKKNNQRQERI